MDSTVRQATPADATAIASIYAPFVEETHVTFETVVPDADTMATRIRETTKRLPWLVATDDDDLLGYAYASPFHERAAYQWTVTVSVYVAPTAQRQGVARELYGSLFSVLQAQGVRSVVAIIALPNPASVAFHEALGFEQVAHFEDAGHKQGAWHDVGHWQRTLQPSGGDPEDLTPVTALPIDRLLP